MLLGCIMTSLADIADIQGKIDEVIARRRDRLLLLETERRGASKDALVFVGIVNVANSHWCRMKSVLQSRSEEWMFFDAYLRDRLLYAYLLGMIRKLPRLSKDLLVLAARFHKSTLKTY